MLDHLQSGGSDKCWLGDQERSEREGRKEKREKRQYREHRSHRSDAAFSKDFQHLLKSATFASLPLSGVLPAALAEVFESGLKEGH